MLKSVLQLQSNISRIAQVPLDLPLVLIDSYITMCFYFAKV